jgi:hypothetical protein
VRTEDQSPEESLQVLRAWVLPRVRRDGPGQA